jgi:hypothetical protein
MLREHSGDPILLVPMMVPSSPPRRWIEALQRIAELPQMHLAPPVSEHRWLRRRLLTTAVTSQRHAGARRRRAADEYRAVARRTAELCLATTTA